MASPERGKEYPIILGKSFFESKDKRPHVCFRYDFVPASANREKTGIVQFAENGTVTIAHHNNKEGDKPIIFEGDSEIARETDLILIFEGSHFRLEKIVSHVNHIKTLRKTTLSSQFMRNAMNSSTPNSVKRKLSSVSPSLNRISPSPVTNQTKRIKPHNTSPNLLESLNPSHKSTTPNHVTPITVPENAPLAFTSAPLPSPDSVAPTALTASRLSSLLIQNDIRDDSSSSSDTDFNFLSIPQSKNDTKGETPFQKQQDTILSQGKNDVVPLTTKELNQNFPAQPGIENTTDSTNIRSLGGLPPPDLAGTSPSESSEDHASEDHASEKEIVNHVEESDMESSSGSESVESGDFQLP